MPLLKVKPQVTSNEPNSPPAEGKRTVPNPIWLPLDPSRSEIRVLKLRPGSGVVECHLEQVSLDDIHPEYSDFLLAQERQRSTQLDADRDGNATHQWTTRCRETCIQEHQMCQGFPFPSWRFQYHHMEWKEAAHAFSISRKVKDPWPSAHMPVLRSRRHSRGIENVAPLIPDRFCVQQRYIWGDYEALSYCWESEAKEGVVELDGKRVRVPQNLEAALQEMRNLPEIVSGMKLWCDALCIDQEDTEEKNQQVGMMKTIFQSAFAVLSWLGPESTVSNRAMDAIVQADFLRKHYRSDDFRAHHHEKWVTTLPWEDIVLFVSRGYWGRLWILQELALNHNMTLFLCGNRPLTRGMMATITALGHNLASQITHKIQWDRQSKRKEPNLLQEQLFEVARHASTIVTLRVTASDAGSRDLSMALDLCQRASCKDSKDKIYGLLGLFPEEIANQISPDYNLPMSELYANFAQMLLAKRGLTGLLSWSCASKEDALPSWIPDWRKKFPRNHVKWLMRHKADNGLASTLPTTIKDARLHCRGVTVDSIATLSKSASESLGYRVVPEASQKGTESNSIDQKDKSPVPNRYGVFCDVSEAVQYTLMMAHPGGELTSRLTSCECGEVHDTLLGNVFWVDWDMLENDLDDHTGRWSSFWRYTMAAVVDDPLFETFDRFRQTNADFDVLGHPLRAFFPSMELSKIRHRRRHSRGVSWVAWPEQSNPGSVPSAPPKDNLTDKDHTNIIRTAITLAGRKLMTTRTGYVGLVPEDAVEEDTIAVLYGCKFPVVLRRVSDVAEKPEGLGRTFRYIGECYVHGIMEGEAVREMQSGKLDEVDIVLV